MASEAEKGTSTHSVTDIFCDTCFYHSQPCSVLNQYHNVANQLFREGGRVFPRNCLACNTSILEELCYCRYLTSHVTYD